MTKEQINNEVKKNEYRDRIIASKVLQDYAFDEAMFIMTVSAKTLDCHYDLVGEQFDDKKEQYICEVKENTTNPKYKVKAIIKRQKIQDIKRLSHGRKCYFISLLDQKFGYIFDIDKIPWNKVKMLWLKQKKTQVDDNSEMVILPTYFIDYSLAIFKCNVEKYYKDYALLKETEKETFLPKA